MFGVCWAGRDATLIHSANINAGLLRARHYSKLWNYKKEKFQPFFSGSSQIEKADTVEGQCSDKDMEGGS